MQKVTEGEEVSLPGCVGSRNKFQKQNKGPWSSEERSAKVRHLGEEGGRERYRRAPQRESATTHGHYYSLRAVYKVPYGGAKNADLTLMESREVPPGCEEGEGRMGTQRSKGTAFRCEMNILCHAYFISPFYLSVPGLQGSAPCTS